MQSKSVILAAWFGLAAVISSPASAQAAAPAPVAAQFGEASAAAALGLEDFSRQNAREFGGRLPAGFPLALAGAGELAGLKLGRGFPVYSISPQQLQAADADLSRMMTPVGNWRFVILSGGKPVGLVTVEKRDGRWQAASFGAAALSRNLEAAAASHPGAQARFLRVYQAQSDFLEMTAAGGKPRFAALLSARQALSLTQEEALLDGADLIEPLRAAVRANLASFR